MFLFQISPLLLYFNLNEVFNVKFSIFYLCIGILNKAWSSKTKCRQVDRLVLLKHFISPSVVGLSGNQLFYLIFVIQIYWMQRNPEHRNVFWGSTQTFSDCSNLLPANEGSQMIHCRPRPGLVMYKLCKVVENCNKIRRKVFPGCLWTSNHCLDAGQKQN